MRRILPLFLFFLLIPRGIRASFDEFADQYSPVNLTLRSDVLSLTLKGEAEMELHDLEGKGGPGYDSPTDTRTIGTRSPFVEIDSFWLALRLSLAPPLQVNSVLEFTTRDAYVGAVWLDYRAKGPDWLYHHLELGYHTPIVKIDRRTERYPLVGTIYWREPELHAAWEFFANLGSDVSLELGLSAAMMRPLDLAGVQESTSQVGTINVLSYGPTEPYSGNSPVAGGRLRLNLYGAFLEGFGFTGRLAAEMGTDVLRSGFPNYTDLPGYEDDNPDTHFFWTGARVGYQAHNLCALVEAITSREGLIRRWGGYAQLSYRLRLHDGPLFHTLEPLVRAETMTIPDGDTVQASGRALRSTAPINAVAWDYDILTGALIVGTYRDLVKLRFEYYWIREHNGVPDLSQPDEPIANNEFLAQVELRF